ncbi:endonuclease V, putative [Entamoeba dispar SAW760]|uniref:Endonuclease V, putative n=1 Tax=Entamoeba dispar (strain ATCC PRA-260 / SAW760) TaxID=370354 RepID=B0EKA8_ENTDS|nr:endonuclease V, putative [Entamoeba dispar SAW760]EDR25041.1 endonuclease V, putative [Entamoeba dispar SAW760]|eukprot:EDR25041.1 endonuclease V, putative [Entamoeba dispar SAW760]
MEKQWEKYQILHSKDVVLEDSHEWTLDTLRRVGGLDISFSTNHPDLAIGCLVICEYPSGKELLTLTSQVYHELLNNCKEKYPELYPEVVLVDGNGYYHPRRFGSATHVGICCDIPSIGVAKTVLCDDGIGKKEINIVTSQIKAGESTIISTSSGEVLCGVIRSRGGSINPIVVSCGHKVSLSTAVNICKECCLHKIPEPIRLADLISRNLLRNEGLLPHMNSK